MRRFSYKRCVTYVTYVTFVISLEL